MPNLVEICLKFLEKRILFYFVNVFSLFRNYLPLEKGRVLHLCKLESPSPKDALCQVWLKAAQLFSRRRFLNLFNVFSLFHNYLHCAKFGRNWLSGSIEKKIFFISSMYFCYLVIISPWKRVLPFF